MVHEVKPFRDMRNFLVMDAASKRKFLCDCGRKFGLDVLVETGTCDGDTVQYALSMFSRIHSIELHEDWADRASCRFLYEPHVSIYKGDSASVLPELLKGIDQPCLFWLDAHFSGHDTAKGSVDCPVMEELKAIREYARPNSVVVIDDAFMFCEETDDSWPPIDRLMNDMRRMFPENTVINELGVVMMHPREWHVSFDRVKR